MAKTTRPYTGDGVQTIYPIDFTLGFLNRDYVFVYLDSDDYNTQLSYTWVDDSQIQLDAPVAAGVTFTIRRIVPRDTLVNDYEDGAILREENLDQSFKQTLMVIEEVQDGFADPDGIFLMDSVLNMLGHRITNLGEATTDTDAVPLGQMKQFVIDEQGGLELVNRAETAADEAETAETNTEALYNQFRDDYEGHGSSFPSGLNDGTLFYYDGPEFTQGLYITYAYNNDPYTGTWDLVSGVGPQGATGAQGPQGPVGLQGEQGLTGAQGIQGQTGIQGAQGDVGPAGIKGETGAQGPEGPQGIEGPVGPQGPQGVTGNEGPQGVVGNEGPQGIVGPQGDSFQVDEVGLLADRVNFDNEDAGFSYLALDAQNITDAEPNFDRFVGDGTKSAYLLSFIPDGQQTLEVLLGGVTQAPDQYTVSSTTTPETCTVSFNSTVPDGMNVLVREFSISTGYGEIYFKNSNSVSDWSGGLPFGRGPRGDQGPQGVAGVQGSQGEQGSVGPTGPAGPQGPQGIVGPQGAQGDIGPQGQQGPIGERGPDGVQGIEGPRGTTGNQGPQGIKGATGSQGAQGPTGAQGARGDTGPTGPTGPKGATGDDGADGRSSSGLLKYFTKKTSSSSITPSATLGTFNISSARDFKRMVKVTQVFAFGSSSASRELSTTLNFTGGGYNINARGARTPLTLSSSELNVASLTIPTGVSGVITVGAVGINSYTSWSFNLTGAGDFPASGGDVLLELFQEPTDVT